MTGVSLALIVVLGQAPAPDPAELVARLGAPRYAEREAASTALERLGRRALPALRTARDLRDPEVRTRASSLVTKIEGALLTQSTQITLDFQNTPLTDVIKAMSEQSGIKLTLAPENSPNWASRRVTLQAPAPLPFWKAIDRLCDAAHLQYNAGMHGIPNGRDPSFPLFEGGMRPSAPTSDDGPFRISLVGLHFQRDVNFPQVPQGLRPRPEFVPKGAAGRPGPMVNEQFFAQLQVAGEPRLTVSQSGPLKINEAVDDKGQSLATPSNGNLMTQRTSGYFGFASGPVLQINAPLTRPAAPGASIRSFKGVVPVLVASRKPNPLVVSLPGAAGRTFHNDDASLTVHEVRTLANTRQTSIEVTVRPAGASSSAAAASENGMAFPRNDGFQQQIEVSNAQGQPLPWYQTSFDGESGRMTLTLAAPDQAAPATELRYYSLVRANTEVRFEFGDVPLP